MNEEILKRLDTLGAKLETTGTELFRAMVANEHLYGVYMTFAAVFLLLVTLVCLAGVIEGIRKDDDDLVLGSSIVLIVALLFLGPVSWDAIQGLFTPEAAALKTLINSLK